MEEAEILLIRELILVLMEAGLSLVEVSRMNDDQLAEAVKTARARRRSRQAETLPLVECKG